jgi:hypothetical protein
MRERSGEGDKWLEKDHQERYVRASYVGNGSQISGSELRLG